MRPTVEERLARAGQTLDDATAARAASAHAGDGGPVGSRGSGARWVTGVVAASVAVLVIGVAVVVASGSGPKPEPAAGAAAKVSDAVDATRSVSAMAVDVHGAWSFAPDGADFIWDFGAPDRWEQMSQSDQPRIERNPPGGATVRLYVGDKTWGTEAGRWRAETPPHSEQPAPVTMLDQIAATDCAVEEGGQLVAWNSRSGSCPTDANMPSTLPVGTWVWAIILDDDGRFDEVRSGEVVDLGTDVHLENSPDPLTRVSAVHGGAARFWYDNVPEVSGEPKE